MNAANVWSLVLDFFTGRMPYHYEMRAFAMALQGSLIVKNGPNKMGEMDPFHALALSTIFGFGGSWFTGMWLGKPTSMISNGDVNITLCLLAFGLVNYTPVSTLLNKILPLKMCMVSFAQLFRSLGMIAFITQAYNEVGASKYYPTPILGPVLYGALLGNMGGFFMKGFEGHLKNGVPWSFQNGKSHIADVLLCGILQNLTPTLFFLRCCCWVAVSFVCARSRRFSGFVLERPSSQGVQFFRRTRRGWCLGSLWSTDR